LKKEGIMILINDKLVSQVSQKAKASTRKRMNHNFHTDLADTFQRMLNCLEPETYCRPHMHANPPKREVFIILKGSAVVLQFDNRGNIIEYFHLNSAVGNYGVEIPPATWHTIIALEPDTVVYECKDGPYVALTDKDFASWAPEEGSAETAAYNRELLKKIGL
jgi:cupin fold WbuC family metalloprotein